MAKSEPLLVDCGPRDKRIAAVVCPHMICAGQVPVGCVKNSEDPNDLQTWHHAGEEEFQVAGEMSDAFRVFNGMSVACAVSFTKFKARHAMKGH